MRTEEELAETEQDIEIMNILGAFEGYNPIAAIEVSRYVTDKVITAVKNAGVVIQNENTTDDPSEFYDDCPCKPCKYCKAAVKTATSDPATLTVKQKLQAEIRELKLERDLLKRKVEAAKVALTHYADRKRWTYGGFDDNYITYISDNKYKKDGFHVAAAALKELEGSG